jgi:hypothetical protein
MAAPTRSGHRRGQVAALVAMLAGPLAAGCTTPPTATPGAAPTVAVATALLPTPGSQTIEITLPPPATVPVVTPQSVTLGELQTYREPAGRFSIGVPAGWVAQPQQVTTAGDIQTAIVFPEPTGNGLVTVTQFDNGKTPAAFGSTVNGMLKQTGLTERPGYLELGREQVPDRQGTALRVEVLYELSNGLPMHSLVQFQLDGTTFSLVNAGVEEQSWSENEERLREILRSYTVPAAPGP